MSDFRRALENVRERHQAGKTGTRVVLLLVEGPDGQMGFGSLAISPELLKDFESKPGPYETAARILGAELDKKAKEL